MPDVIGHDLIRHRVSNGSRYETIHKASCRVVRRLKHPVPWNWAEGRPVGEWLALGRFTACQICRPDLGATSPAEKGKEHDGSE